MYAAYSRKCLVPCALLMPLHQTAGRAFYLRGDNMKSFLSQKVTTRRAFYPEVTTRRAFYLKR